FVPKTKGVILGLVSTKTPALESIDELKRRTGEAAKFIDFDRLGIGPQCGFASTAAGNPLTVDDERAKLRLLVEAAHALWSCSCGADVRCGERLGDVRASLLVSAQRY